MRVERTILFSRRHARLVAPFDVSLLVGTLSSSPSDKRKAEPTGLTEHGREDGASRW
ncbi:MAG: hypothetical protein WC483_02225 [Candidatus Paceibacterota bacterium]